MKTIYNSSAGEIRHVDALLWAEWQATNNPKAVGWREVPSAPAHDPATQRTPRFDALAGEWVVEPLSAEELAAAARKVWPDAARFWAEFNDTEKLAIIESTVPGILLLREELRLWRGEVWSDDPRVTQGLAGLVAVGILSESRKQNLLSTHA